MTGICQLCRQILTGRPVLELEERDKREFLALAEACQAHLLSYHREFVQALVPLLELTQCYLSTLILDGPGVESLRRQLAQECSDAIRGAEVVLDMSKSDRTIGRQ